MLTTGLLEEESDKRNHRESDSDSHEQVEVSENHDGESQNGDVGENDNGIEQSQLAQEVKRLHNELLLALAENGNLRKRYEKQLQEMKEYAITNFAKDLVTSLDNMNRALSHIPESLNDDVKNIVLGIQMTKDDLVKTFSKYGIKEISPKIGEQFNADLHYAISRQETNEYPDNTIVSIMQIGYKLNDRLLRPAMVVVTYQAK